MNPWYWRIGLAIGTTAGFAWGLWRRSSAHNRSDAPNDSHERDADGGSEPEPPHEPRPTTHLFPDSVTIMGHRGAAAVAPENTMVAFGVAARLELPFELDVRRCQSGELVAVHDATLERTTSGRGRVAETPWSTIRTLDAGSRFNPEYAGQRVPALDTVLATLGGEVVINIELKTDASTDAPQLKTIARSLVKLLDAHDVVEQVMVSAFDPRMLDEVRLADERVIRGLIVSGDGPTPKRAKLRPEPDLLMVEHSLLTPSYIENAKAAGYRLFAWTINDGEEAKRLVEAGVDGLITDDPRRLRDLIMNG